METCSMEGDSLRALFMVFFAEHLRLIANAKRVELKVTGNKINETIKFSDTNIRLFKEFYETQVLSPIVKKK